MSLRNRFISETGEPRWAGLLIVLFILVAGIGAESCATMRRLAGGGESPHLKFSHSAHAKHTPDCATCHVSGFSGEVGRAGHASCATCHEAAREENMPAAGEPGDRTCLLCHHSTAPGPATPAPRPDYSEATFDHGSHASVSCAECHGALTHGMGFGAQPDFPTMEECVACHFPELKDTPSADCLTCHPSLTSGTVPASHEHPRWKQEAHGPVALEREDLCARCHVKELDCDTCHLRERPLSHTPAFRARTHGFHAMSAPNKCEICHTQEFCEVCHRSTQPANHTPAFKGAPFLHCASCHLPLDEGNRCAVCHQGDPHEDVFATPPPPELVEFGLIKPGESCLPCHPVDLVPIPHPYNTIPGEECIVCHRIL